MCSLAGSMIFTQLLFTGWVECKSWADLKNPGSQGDGSFLGITSGFKPVSNGYPGKAICSLRCCLACFCRTPLVTTHNAYKRSATVMIEHFDACFGCLYNGFNTVHVCKSAPLSFSNWRVSGVSKANSCYSAQATCASMCAYISTLLHIFTHTGRQDDGDEVNM